MAIVSDCEFAFEIRKSRISNTKLILEEIIVFIL